MSKVTLQDIASGFASTTKINQNNDTIEGAFDNTLSRDGATPNSMLADLDMNSHRVANLGSPTSANDAARWTDVTAALAISTAIPSQIGNAGKVIKTDGTILSWASPASSALPLHYDATAAEGTAGVTITNFAYPAYDFRRYGAVDDGTTDNTATIVAVLTAFGSTYSGKFYAAPNMKFTAGTVYAALPLRATLEDDSQINAWNTAGFRQKSVGHAEGSDSTAVNDFQYFISSGHNAALNLDNRGTASSSSGINGVAMVQWSRGRLTKQADENGFRALARVEFSKVPGVNKWWYILRRGVPWEANAWEYWYTGKSYTTGDYVLNGTGVFKATTTGTSGATAPVHTSGTVSDGGVSWLSVLPNLDSGVFGVDQHGQIFTNPSPTDGVVAYFKADKYSPGSGGASLFVEADGASQNASLRLRPTNSSGVAVAMPYFLAQDGVGVRLFSSTAGAEFARISDTAGWAWQAGTIGKRLALTYSASMTPDALLADSFTITATNASAFTINAPSNAADGRRLKFTIRNTSGGALGAVTWNAVFKLAAWTSPATGFSRSIEFEYDGTNWIQIAQTGVDVPN